MQHNFLASVASATTSTNLKIAFDNESPQKRHSSTVIWNTVYRRRRWTTCILYFRMNADKHKAFHPRKDYAFFRLLCCGRGEGGFGKGVAQNPHPPNNVHLCHLAPGSLPDFDGKLKMWRVCSTKQTQRSIARHTEGESSSSTSPQTSSTTSNGTPRSCCQLSRRRCSEWNRGVGPYGRTARVRTRAKARRIS